MSNSRSPEPSPPTRHPAACAAVGDWPGYFDAIGDAGPRETLIEALNRFEAEGPIDPEHRPLAVDLGCGTGRDTLELLRRGWRVLALDGVAEGIERMLERPEFAPFRDDAELLEARVATFDETRPPPCELINSSFTLPFCSPVEFEGLWPRLVQALPSGGRFAGQFFGEEDTWATLPGRTHHTREQVESLLQADFEIEDFRLELYGPSPDMKFPKRWHLFHVVARKR